MNWPVDARHRRGASANTPSTQQGLTLIDLLAILAVLAIFVALLLPALGRRYARSARINCPYSLKQVGLGFANWSLDNDRKFPMGVSTNSCGTMEVGTSGLAPHFTVLSNELSTPRPLVCASDDRRVSATNFLTLTDQNISYFLNVSVAEATEPGILLAGDWNITNASRAGTRVVKLIPGETVGWDHRVHQRQGNILRADGSVGQFASGRVPPLITNARLVVPSPTRSE